jgi:hypothetical protein
MGEWDPISIGPRRSAGPGYSGSPGMKTFRLASDGCLNHDHLALRPAVRSELRLGMLLG